MRVLCSKQHSSIETEEKLIIIICFRLVKRLFHYFIVQLTWRYVCSLLSNSEQWKTAWLRQNKFVYEKKVVRVCYIIKCSRCTCFSLFRFLSYLSIFFPRFQSCFAFASMYASVTSNGLSRNSSMKKKTRTKSKGKMLVFLSESKSVLAERERALPTSSLQIISWNLMTMRRWWGWSDVVESAVTLCVCAVSRLQVCRCRLSKQTSENKQTCDW